MPDEIVHGCSIVLAWVDIAIGGGIVFAAIIVKLAEISKRRPMA
jgi:hypothetical protein